MLCARRYVASSFSDYLSYVTVGSTEEFCEASSNDCEGSFTTRHRKGGRKRYAAMPPADGEKTPWKACPKWVGPRKDNWKG